MIELIPLRLPFLRRETVGLAEQDAVSGGEFGERLQGLGGETRFAQQRGEVQDREVGCSPNGSITHDLDIEEGVRKTTAISRG